MRQNQKYPTFTVILKKTIISVGLTVLFAAIVTGCTSCKTQTTVKIPKAILEARDATGDELLDIVNRFDEIKTLLARNLDAEYTSEKIGKGWIELVKQPKSPGMVLLKRPDLIRFVVQYPLTGSNILSLVSIGDEFRVWNHHENEFYIGPNSAGELVSDELEEIPEIPVRAGHILEAIFPATIPLQYPEIHWIVKEEEGEKALYYVLEVFRNDSSPRLQLLREFWIERAGLTLSRQRIYDDGGKIVADISYSEIKQYQKYSMPRKISIERPLDGYTLDLDIKDWEINTDIQEKSFDMKPPEGVKPIRLKNK